MTAEVAIITRQAIALAADSAVTVGREKVWKTANKLFSLGPTHDIAIMIYGSGDFLSLPWEVVIKEFRRRVSGENYKTVRACSEAFKGFLLSEMFDGDRFKKWQRYSILFSLFDIVSGLAGRAHKNNYATDIERVKRDIEVYRALMRGKGNAFADAVPDDVVGSFVGSLVAFAADGDRFGEDIASQLEAEIAALALDFFRSKHESQYVSGIVVAGFGEEELFPALVHNKTDGRWEQHLRWWEDDEGSKDLNDPDQDDEFPIIPFAQQDMPFLFMSGISSVYLSFLKHSLTDLLSSAGHQVIEEYVAPTKRDAAKKAAADIAAKASIGFMEKLYDKVREEQYLPVNRAVMALPKEEMALMAEALVDLTSLKRKVDSKLETVGGPVDVAVISKGDGFVWIKRKHYFKPELNHDFMGRKAGNNGQQS